ncbi:hypothetical protein LXL04_001064 [Taraxacum kok-saghyz]
MWRLPPSQQIVDHSSSIGSSRSKKPILGLPSFVFSDLRWDTETIEIKETLKETYRPAAEKTERGRGKRSTNRSNSRKSVMEKTVETPTARKETECKGKVTGKKKITIYL